MDEKTPTPEPDGDTLELTFVPAWARAPSDVNPYERFAGRDDRDRDRGRDRDRRFGGGRPDRRPGGRPGGSPPRGDRSFRREEGPPRRGERGPPREDRGPPRDSRGPPRESRGPAPDDRRPPRRDDRPFGDRRPSAPPPLPVDISFIPERQRLGEAARRIHHARRAYPLAQLANLFLHRVEFHQLKIEARGGRDADRTGFEQCAVCKALFRSRDAAVEHVATRHADAFFDTEVITGEPPAGHFVCVARCGVTGALIAPPNHHSYAERLQERFLESGAPMAIEDYARRVETVRDPALVEEWRAHAATQRVFRLKSDPARPPMKWIEARAILRSELAPASVERRSRAIVPAAVSREMEDEALGRSVREAWTRENHFPMTMMIALRPALRHMGLHLFKAGENMIFVTAVHPAPIDPAHAIAPIRHALEYLERHPGVTREAMVRDLYPGRPDDDPAVKEVMAHLHWLVEKGHVIEFFDGTLSVPRPAGRRPAAAAGARDGGLPAAP